MPSTAARLHGSGFTVIFFGGQDGHVPIAFARSVTETPPTLVADYVPVQPMDWSRPAEIMTAMAMGAGTIELELIESWSEQAFNRLGGALDPLKGVARGGSHCDNILHIVRAISNSNQGIYVSKLIATPQTSGENQDGRGNVTPKRRAIFYMGAKIVSVQDGDTDVSVETMEQTKRVTFAYTHRVYQFTSPGGTSRNLNIAGPLSTVGGPAGTRARQGGPQMETTLGKNI